MVIYIAEVEHLRFNKLGLSIGYIEDMKENLCELD